MAVAGRVLMIPAGTWTSGKNYAMLDVVIYAGSSYVAKKQINNSTVAPPNATSDWQLLAQGYDVTNVVTKSMIANNFLATDPNTVLSGPMGKSLKDQLDTVNSNLGYEYDYVSGTLSTPTDYLISICNIWLPTGTYIVNSGIRLTLTTTSRVDRYLKIGDVQDGRGSASLALAAGYQVFTHSCIIKISESSKNVVLQARHFNGTTLSVDGWMNVTRLK